MARNYEKENRWQNTPEQVKRRMARNKAREEAIKKGLVKRGDNKEVDHVAMNRKGPLGSKVRIVSKSVNRRKQPKRDGSHD